MLIHFQANTINKTLLINKLYSFKIPGANYIFGGKKIYNFMNDCISVVIGVVWRKEDPQITKFCSPQCKAECAPTVIISKLFNIQRYKT